MDSYIVAYDFADPKRLRKVATICEDFGTRKQYLVFFCRLSATDMVRLRTRLYEVMNVEADQVLFVPVCGKCVERVEALGKPGRGDCDVRVFQGRDTGVEPVYPSG